MSYIVDCINITVYEILFIHVIVTKHFYLNIFRSTPAALSFTATEHLLSIVVNTSQPASDLKIKIR